MLSSQATLGADEAFCPELIAPSPSATDPPRADVCASEDLLSSELLSQLMGSNTNLVLPLPLPLKPLKPDSNSPRLRKRFKDRLKVWKIAVGIVTLINNLNSGDLAGSHRSTLRGHGDARALAAQQSILGRILKDSAIFAKGRRDFPTGGRQALLQVLKAAREVDGYVQAVRALPMVPIIASRLIEPASDKVVDMLEALPPAEACFYSSENNCVDWAGKSTVILHELESQYGFIGGDTNEYIQYFNRDDLPNGMWTWRLFSDCKTFGGFYRYT